MVISTEVYVSHPNIALCQTIRTLPDARVGVVSDAGTDPDHDVHYFWFDAPDFEEVSAALAADDTVADFSVIMKRANRWTYRVEYSDEVLLVTPRVAAVGGVTLDSRSDSNGWILELQLRDHDALYALNEYASEAGIHFDILKLNRTDDPFDPSEYGLTECQREALVAAYVNGYFDDPRETSLEELSELLDISPTAISGRLRRGFARLVEAVLVEDETG